MEDLGRLLRRSKQVHNRVWSEEVGNALTPRQHGVLTAVHARSGLSQAELNDLLDNMDRATAGGVIRRLTSRGWIDVARDPADVRRMVLSLTGVGAEARESFEPKVTRVQERILELVSAPIRPQFTSLLFTLLDRDDRPRHGSRLDQAPGAVRAIGTSVGPLLRGARLWHAELWRRAEPVLTVPQFDLLLAASESVAQSQLSAALVLDPASVGQIVKILERQGFVARAVDRGDTRRRLIRVTEPGERTLSHLTDLAARVAADFLSPLAASDRARLVHGLSDIANDSTYASTRARSAPARG